jgi:hypothetical protein
VRRTTARNRHSGWGRSACPRTSSRSTAVRARCTHRPRHTRRPHACRHPCRRGRFRGRGRRRHRRCRRHPHRTRKRRDPT